MNGDRPAQAAKAASEGIEVTPEMVEAGAEVLAVWYAEPYPANRLRAVAEDVFQAMAKARGCP